jgi:hypothetical protein
MDWEVDPIGRVVQGVLGGLASLGWTIGLGPGVGALDDGLKLGLLKAEVPPHMLEGLFLLPILHIGANGHLTKPLSWPTINFSTGVKSSAIIAGR